MPFQAHPLPQSLPTQARIKSSVFKVQKAIQRLFQGDPDPIFDLAPSQPAKLKVYWRGKKHPAEITLFKSVVNENDAYVSCEGKAVCKSRVYTDGSGEPLDLLEDYQIHIIPQGANECLVKVIALNCRVEWAPNRGIFSMAKNDVKIQRPVDPTTVEENRLLEGIRKELLQKD